MTAAPELLPCPFCGGKPYLANVEMVGCSYVVCTDCRAQGDDMSKDRAIATWNTRAPVLELIRQAVEAERERCAALMARALDVLTSGDFDASDPRIDAVAEYIAAIRAREQGR